MLFDVNHNVGEQANNSPGRSRGLAMTMPCAHIFDADMHEEGLLDGLVDANRLWEKGRDRFSGNGAWAPTSAPSERH